MIIIKNEDILNFTKGTIIHQVNCFTMGSGVAKVLFDKYRIIKTKHEAFIRYCQASNISPLGLAQFVNINEDLTIVNLFGQFNYGYDGVRYTNYIAFSHALADVLMKCQTDIAIPCYIGSGKGGADWKRIYNIIETLSLDYPYTIYIYRKDK